MRTVGTEGEGRDGDSRTRLGTAGREQRVRVGMGTVKTGGQGRDGDSRTGEEGEGKDGDSRTG